MIHLYCAVDDVDAAREACAGFCDDEVLVVLQDRVACLGRPCERMPAVEARALVEHDRLLRRVMERCAVAPFRYGTVLATPADIYTALAPCAGAFEEMLGRLRGRVELALRAGAASLSEEPAGDANGEGRTGRAYLRRLSERADLAAVMQLHRTLAASAVAAVAEPEPDGGIKASYLVGADEVDGFSRLVAQTVGELKGMGEVSLTGPWVPYSFAALPSDCGLAVSPATGGGHGA